LKAVKPDAGYMVEETLWEGKKCVVRVNGL